MTIYHANCSYTLLKPIMLYGSQIWGPELLSLKTDFDKCQIEQVHLKFCTRVLIVPWYAPNTGCRTELGRLPLSQKVKCAIQCYMTRLSYNISNDLLKSAAKYAFTHNTNFQRICQQIKSETKMHVQNVTSNYETKRIKKSVLKNRNLILPLLGKDREPIR